MKKKNFYCIVGCGSLGVHLAKTLSENGGEVLVIDRDKKSFKKLGQNFGGMTIEGDATDLEFISELNIKNAAALVAVTEEDNINLMVCQIAKGLYGLKVIARLYNSERESVYKEFGIETICPEELVAAFIEKKMTGERDEN
jgi:trk system potassium uptake protein TrkA